MIWIWIGFITFVLAMLALDLGVFNRKAHVVSVKEALLFSAITGVALRWPTAGVITALLTVFLAGLAAWRTAQATAILRRGIEQVETILCDFHALAEGRYYVGHDIDQMQEQLDRARALLRNHLAESEEAAR